MSQYSPRWSAPLIGKGKYWIVVVAIAAAVAGAGMHFMNAAHERQLADLRKELERAKAAEAAAVEAKARAEAELAERAAAEAKVAAALRPGDSLYEQAVELERAGNGLDAVRAYLHAARAGSGRAALRLAHVYEKGDLGVERNYAESLKWYNAAGVLGEDVSRNSDGSARRTGIR